MSELKDYSILDIEAIDDERFKKEKAPGKWVTESRVYLKSDVDAVIAEKDRALEYAKALTLKDIETIKEKDKEIAELKQKLEDAGVRERRLNNALDKERSETIKYMDELCNAKNEIERLTIDKRNDELRADVADGTVEKLKAENAELKQKIESVQASMYADVVDAGMENRRLKRALWLRRVETAKIEIRYWRERLFNEPSTTRAGIHGQRLIPPKTFRTIREWLTIWDNVERKCLAKAEEYK